MSMTREEVLAQMESSFKEMTPTQQTTSFFSEEGKDWSPALLLEEVRNDTEMGKRYVAQWSKANSTPVASSYEDILAMMEEDYTLATAEWRDSVLYTRADGTQMTPTLVLQEVRSKSVEGLALAQSYARNAEQDLALLDMLDKVLGPEEANKLLEQILGGGGRGPIADDSDSN